LALRPASQKDGYRWAVIFGLILSVYALFWQGWGLLFFIGIACALGGAAYHFFIIKDKTKTRQKFIVSTRVYRHHPLIVSLCFSFQISLPCLKKALGS